MAAPEPERSWGQVRRETRLGTGMPELPRYDRLGPYASARLKSTTFDNRVVTTLELHWPDELPAEEWRLHGMLIPVPAKLRLSAVRLRALAHEIAQAVADGIPAFEGLEVHTRFCRGATYRAKAYDFKPFVERTPRVYARDGIVSVCRPNRIGHGQRSSGGYHNRCD